MLMLCAVCVVWCVTQGALPAKQETLPQGAARLEYWPVAALVTAPDAKVRLTQPVAVRVMCYTSHMCHGCHAVQALLHLLPLERHSLSHNNQYVAAPSSAALPAMPCL